MEPTTQRQRIPFQGKGWLVALAILLGLALMVLGARQAEYDAHDTGTDRPLPPRHGHASQQHGG